MAKLKKDNVMYFHTRDQWRKWLSQNFETASDVWFVFPTVASGEKGVSYNDAVEEALCFGWIDSTAGKLDDTHGLRRFCRRKPSSSYSRPNVERLIWLDGQNMLHPSVRTEVATLISTPYVFPDEILAELKKDETVWQNFQKFTEPYKRIRIDYIYSAKKRPQEYAKRLANFIAKTRQNKIIVGFGGIEKYYK